MEELSLHPTSSPMQETRVPSLGQEDPLAKEMATHSSILAQEIPWTEEPVGLQSMGLKTAGHDWATKQSQILNIINTKMNILVLRLNNICFSNVDWKSK